MSHNKKFFDGSNKYKELLEMKYLVRQNNFVLALIFLVGLLSIGYLIILDFELRTILGLSSGFILLILFNIASLAYGQYQVEFYKFNKYITSLGFFTLIVIYVLFFKSPSIIPFLFLGYLVAAIYKDIKVLTMISFYFILAMASLLVNYGELFDFQTIESTNFIVIGIFVFLFLSLLMMSTYITLKESQFFYNQISFTKEKEIRNIDLLIQLKDQVDVEVFNHQLYYGRLNKLFDAFSSKLKIDNIFKEKLSMIEQLASTHQKDDVLKQYPQYTLSDLERLESLVIKKDNLIRKIALKIFYYNQKEIHQREIFSETHFESLNKSTDDIEIKILAFSVLYVLLRKGMSGYPSLTKDQIYDTITQTDFYFSLDPYVRKIFIDNPEVFEVIYCDAYEGVSI